VSEHLILSLKHAGSIATWWMPDCCGYTNNLEAAGRYTLKQTNEICSPCGYDDSIPVPVSVAYTELRCRRIVDLGDAGNRALLDSLQRRAKKGGGGE
jgi:hypothetical protein